MNDEKLYREADIRHVPCAHAGEPHTVYIGLDDGGPPVPMEKSFDNQADALEYAGRFGALSRASGVWLIKVFRSDNESYTCFQWSPQPIIPDKTEPIYKLRERKPWTAERAMHAAGQGVAFIIAAALAVIVLMLVAAAVVFVYGALFGG